MMIQMSKDLIESIENVHQEIIELRNEQNEFRVSITKYVTSMSRDTEWMREKIDDINTKFDKCGFCKNPEEIISFKKEIKEMKDEQTKVKYTAYGGAAVLSILITTVVYFIENKEKFFT